MPALRFTKMHGLGNDFIVFDAPPAPAACPTRAQWRALADRHTGIGFDQALVIERAAPRRHRRLLPHLQCRRRRGRAVRQRRALRRRAAAPAGPRAAPAAIAHGQPRRPRSTRELERAGHGRRSTWACRISLRRRCRFDARRGAGPTLRARRRRRSRVEFGVASMGNPHAVLASPTSPARRSPARRRARSARRVPAARQRRLPAGRRRAATSGCACSSAASARRRPAAPAPAPRLQSAAKLADCSTRRRASSCPAATLSIRWAGPGEHLWLDRPR